MPPLLAQDLLTSQMMKRPNPIARLLLGLLVSIQLHSLAGCTTLGMTTIPLDELKAKYANEHSKFVKLGKMDIHYRDEGKGPVLVLVHGVCASLHMWDGWVKELKDRYRIVRLDLPGFGLTGSGDPLLFDRDFAVRALRLIFEELGLERFYLAGGSLGGYIAWNYALIYPQQVRKLILVDTVGYNQELPMPIKLASFPLVRPFARHMMPRFFFNSAIEEIYGNKSKLTEATKNRYFELAMREGNTSSYVDVFIEMRRMNESEDISRGIKDISVPTLVMWGTLDRWVPFEHFERWRKDLRDGTFVAYPGVGHTPMEEEPQKTAHDVHRFLSGALGNTKTKRVARQNRSTRKK